MQHKVATCYICPCDKYQIVGVVKDFNYQSLRKIIYPLYINVNESKAFPIFNFVIRYLPGQGIKALDRSRKLVVEMFPEYRSELAFQNDRIRSLYQSEKKEAQLIEIATLLVLLISCTGMFALSLYEAERRTKEIGIRKINGATIGNILTLLSKDFLKWVFIAFILASPISYLIMKKWLEGFAYNTPISWWIFALAGASAIFITILVISYQTYVAARKNPVEVLRYE